MRRTASQDWNGTPEQALALLRAEYSYRRWAPVHRMLGRQIRRHPAHARALRSIPGDYARKLGVLCAAAPESSRRAIKEAFSAILGPADAATMRGVADGTEFAFDISITGALGYYPSGHVTLDGAGGDGVRRLAYCRRVPTDRRGAEDLREELEREALAAGAERVDVRFRRERAA